MIIRSEVDFGRRMLVSAAVAGALVTSAPDRPAEAEPLPSLRQAAARANLLFGSDSDVDILRARQGYGDLFVHNCDLLAPQLSWKTVAPGRYGSDPAREDPNIAFARAHRLRLAGGHLLWHENMPSWFGELRSHEEAIHAVKRHIVSMTGRYGPITYAWNVVNEAIEPRDGRADGLRDTRFLQLLGGDYIEMAFRIAREAAPHALLVYNDYGFEFNRAADNRRRTVLLRLLDRLQAARVPIDGVGLQSHLKLDGSQFESNTYRSFLHDLGGRGLAIIISELDVLDLRPVADIAELDANVGSLYAEFLTAALEEPAVTALITWGLSDRYTWLTPQRDSHYRRRDGLPNRPLPFDAFFRPKPAFYAILSALQRAPPRRAA